MQEGSISLKKKVTQGHYFLEEEKKRFWSPEDYTENYHLQMGNIKTDLGFPWNHAPANHNYTEFNCAIIQIKHLEVRLNSAAVLGFKGLASITLQ